MQLSSQPTPIPLVWAEGASSPYINPIPTPSQIGIKNGAASYTDGFPPDCFIPFASGGAGPFGSDFNGVLNQITAGLQWTQAGNFLPYSATYSTIIGGYANGAIVQSAVVPGKFWRSLADNNTTNPDTGGANWVLWPTRAIVTANLNFFVNSSTGSDTNNGSSGTPWLTYQHAYNYVQQNYDLAEQYTVTINCTGNFTAALSAIGPIAGITSPASITFSFTTGSTATVANNHLFHAVAGAQFTVTTTSGTLVVLSTTGSTAGLGDIIVADGAGSGIGVGQVNFGNAYASHVSATNSGQVSFGQNYTISSGASSHYIVDAGGVLTVTPSLVVSLVSTPGFTNFASTIGPGELNAQNVTYSGSATGTRYSAGSNGVIKTGGGGANYFPGNGPGTVNLVGGVYGNGSGQYT